MSTLSIIPPKTASQTRKNLSSWKHYVPAYDPETPTADIAVNHDHILYGK